MGRQYVDFSKPKYASKSYKKVGLQVGTQYTSLSMGAGEQRLFTILDRQYSTPTNLLILTDELDLTLHTVALNRLVDTMVRLANEKNLQNVFTSHREELTRRCDINIRHIWKPANQNESLCLEQTTILKGTCREDKRGCRLATVFFRGTNLGTCKKNGTWTIVAMY